MLKEVVSFLMAELAVRVSALSPTDLLEKLVGANEAILTAQALRQLTIPTQLACFGSTETLADQLRRQLPEASAAATGSRVLIEYVVAQPPQGNERLSLAVYDRLLAIVSEIQDWAFASDDIHFGLADHKLEFLPSGRLGVSREAFLKARERFLEARALGEIGRGTENFERHWNRSGSSDPQLDQEREDATRAEFGLPLSMLIDFLWAVIETGKHQESVAKVANKDELLSQLRTSLEWSEEEVLVAFDLFASTARSDFLKPPLPYEEKDAWPWNFNRALSYLRKPLLIRQSESGTEVLWGNRNVYLSGLTLIDLCSSARLKARSPAMRSFIGRRRKLISEEFNDLAAELYGAVPGTVVRRRFKKAGRRRIQRKSGEDLGDIDVLVAIPSERRLLAVETKDLAVARTPAELRHELDAVYESEGRQSADLGKHLERNAWLQENCADVLREVGLPADDAHRWVVEPLVVVSVESLAPYMVSQRVRVVSIQELKREIGSDKA